MSNERNIEALTLLLFQEQAQKPNDQVTYEQLRGTPFKVLAQRLADRGVLVPGAMSDDEALQVVADFDDGKYWGSEIDDPEPPKEADIIRAKLNRISRGEETWEAVRRDEWTSPAS